MRGGQDKLQKNFVKIKNENEDIINKQQKNVSDK